MAYAIEQADVQQWLSDTKTPVPDLADSPHVDSAFAKVFGFLRSKFNTTDWVDQATTPSLVHMLLTMEIAGRLWLKHYGTRSGEEEGSYGKWLISRVNEMLAALASGDIALIDADDDVIDPESPEWGQPVFFPTDAATTLYEEEGDVEGSAPRHFSMGKAF